MVRIMADTRTLEASFKQHALELRQFEGMDKRGSEFARDDHQQDIEHQYDAC